MACRYHERSGNYHGGLGETKSGLYARKSTFVVVPNGSYPIIAHILGVFRDVLGVIICRTLVMLLTLRIPRECKVVTLDTAKTIIRTTD